MKKNKIILNLVLRTYNQAESIAALQRELTEMRGEMDTLEHDIEVAYVEKEGLRTMLHKYETGDSAFFRDMMDARANDEHWAKVNAEEELAALFRKLKGEDEVADEDGYTEEEMLRNEVAYWQNAYGELRAEEYVVTPTAPKVEVKRFTSIDQKGKVRKTVHWRKIVARLLEEPAGTKLKVNNPPTKVGVASATRKYQLQHEWKGGELYVWYPSLREPEADGTGV